MVSFDELVDLCGEGESCRVSGERLIKKQIKDVSGERKKSSLNHLLFSKHESACLPAGLV